MEIKIKIILDVSKGMKYIHFKKLIQRFKIRKYFINRIYSNPFTQNIQTSIEQFIENFEKSPINFYNQKKKKN
jgi:lantibiotic modifying enzyme